MARSSPPFLIKGNAEAGMGLGELGVEGQRLPVAGDGPVQLALGSQGIAEVVVDGAGIGPQGQRRPVIADGRPRLLRLLRQRMAQLEVEPEVMRMPRLSCRQ